LVALFLLKVSTTVDGTVGGSVNTPVPVKETLMGDPEVLLAREALADFAPSVVGEN
jgi:hypothetical protein